MEGMDCAHEVWVATALLRTAMDREPSNARLMASAFARSWGNYRRVKDRDVGATQGPDVALLTHVEAAELAAAAHASYDAPRDAATYRDFQRLVATLGQVVQHREAEFRSSLDNREVRQGRSSDDPPVYGRDDPTLSSRGPRLSRADQDLAAREWDHFAAAWVSAHDARFVDAPSDEAQAGPQASCRRSPRLAANRSHSADACDSAPRAVAASSSAGEPSNALASPERRRQLFTDTASASAAAPAISERARGKRRMSDDSASAVTSTVTTCGDALPAAKRSRSGAEDGALVPGDGSEYRKSKSYQGPIYTADGRIGRFTLDGSPGENGLAFYPAFTSDPLLAAQSAIKQHNEFVDRCRKRQEKLAAEQHRDLSQEEIDALEELLCRRPIPCSPFSSPFPGQDAFLQAERKSRGETRVVRKFHGWRVTAKGVLVPPERFKPGRHKSCWYMGPEQAPIRTRSSRFRTSGGSPTYHRSFASV